MTQMTSGQSASAGPGGRIAVIQAGWHKDMTDRARDGFTATMAEHGADPARTDLYEVPGAFEIPLTAQRLAATGRYAAIVAIGFVVDGGIYRHDFVASAVIDGLMRVQLDGGVPVLSVVLTPHHFHESEDHVRFFREHMTGKGREAAESCLQILDLDSRLAA
ncbi:6,7-dimethyl-8-ribityllumazine synthase [Nisaea acidiphila]|uniref:6,7-dimethyl-8-ribityllumazine synthase n=1 Tax=Nisaea acidiphila TaxID=1862145 RepID=A0A9J7AUQ8_9PROT|nr:6,7-dimethyl-8-ribityllumazine synthase [Nisaea acidiphila]UUX51063.1 6,7-dimethyl-8-ribityllumazine synthase [Nisaea acidiphila]